MTYLKRFFIVTSALLLILLGSFAIACEEETPTSSNGDSSSGNSEESAENLSIGQSAQTSELRVTIISANTASSYEWREDWKGDPYTEEASTGKTFIIIDARAENIGENSVYVAVTSFSMTDSEGYKYDWTYYMADDALESQDLYSGQQSRGELLFEVPDTATGLKVFYDFGYFEDKIASWVV